MNTALEGLAEEWRHTHDRPGRAALRVLQALAFTVPARWRVASGPFKGQRLVGITPRMPYVLGTYEAEILPFLTAAVSHAGVTRLIDIGAADGYYAAGLARIVDDLAVIAFEAGPTRQKVVRRAAELNCVDSRIDVRGWCDLEALASTLAENSSSRLLVLCDIGRGEYDLLDPTVVHALRSAPILVEVHGDRGDELRSRFVATHDITAFAYTPRDPGRSPVGRVLLGAPGGRAFLADAMDERRHDALSWLGMWPRDLVGGPACGSPS